MDDREFHDALEGYTLDQRSIAICVLLERAIKKGPPSFKLPEMFAVGVQRGIIDQADMDHILTEIGICNSEAAFGRVNVTADGAISMIKMAGERFKARVEGAQR